MATNRSARAAIFASLSGGEALKRHLAHIAAELGHGATVRVGFMADATYPSDASKGKQALHVAQVAFWNEFGTSRAPARPFIRRMIASKSPRWGIDLGKELRAVDYDSLTALRRMGEGIKDQMVNSIRTLTEPPLSPATVAARAARYRNKSNSDAAGLSKPLIDTGVMQRSVDYQVLTGQDE